MSGLAGLRSQSLVRGLPVLGRGFSRGLMPLRGLVSTKSLVLSASPSNIDASGEAGTLNSGVVTVSQNITHRAEVFSQVWIQKSGLPGVVVPHVSGGVYFQHSGLPSDATSSFVWRCTANNQFGEGGAIDVAFTLTRYTPIPPLTGSGSPSSRTIVPIDPTTRIGTCYFSASGSGGVPPYTYNWGGGDFPTSASNQASFYIPPGATEGIDFDPGCTITDSIGQSIVVGAGPFFIMEE